MFAQGWHVNSTKLITGGRKEEKGVALVSRAPVPAIPGPQCSRKIAFLIAFSTAIGLPPNYIVPSPRMGQIFDLREKRLEMGEG